jgi:phage-related minor tail protein
MRREAKKYLDYARECARQAEEADTAELRDKLMELSRVWMSAALTEASATQQMKPARQPV